MEGGYNYRFDGGVYYFQFNAGEFRNAEDDTAQVKFQVPNSKQSPKYNFQITSFGIWVLELEICLKFGACDWEFKISGSTWESNPPSHLLSGHT